MPAHVRLPHANHPGVDTRSNPAASPKQIAFIERLVEERDIDEVGVSWVLSRVRRHKDTSDRYFIPKYNLTVEGEQRTGASAIINRLLARPLRPGYVKDRKAAFVQAPFGSLPPTEEQVARQVELTLTEPVPGAHEVAPTPPPLRRTHSVAAEVGVYRHNDKVYVVRKRRGREYRYATVLVELGRPRLNDHGQTVTHDFVPAHGMQYELSAEERITDDEEIKSLCIKVGRCIMCSHAIWQAKSVARMMGTRCYKRAHGLI